MRTIASLFALATAISGLETAVAAFDCSFKATYPRQYVAHKLASGQTIALDGNLDDDAWKEVPFSDDFVDMCVLAHCMGIASEARGGCRSTTTKPRLRTNMKMRYDDRWLYVGALLEETQIWANILSTCRACASC